MISSSNSGMPKSDRRPLSIYLPFSIIQAALKLLRPLRFVMTNPIKLLLSYHVSSFPENGQ